MLKPAPLLVEYRKFFKGGGPILDLACGEGHNSVLLAQAHLPVICCDVSRDALAHASKLAAEHGVAIEAWPLDLEAPGTPPLPEEAFAGIIVFRYLHRPLIPSIRKALKPGGILIYETFTTAQRRFGRPRNPDFLLKPGELFGWFADWEVIHAFEGGLGRETPRAVAQIVCRKPVSAP